MFFFSRAQLAETELVLTEKGVAWLKNFPSFVVSFQLFIPSSQMRVSSEVSSAPKRTLAASLCKMAAAVVCGRRSSDAGISRTRLLLWKRLRDGSDVTAPTTPKRKNEGPKRRKLFQVSLVADPKTRLRSFTTRRKAAAGTNQNALCPSCSFEAVLVCSTSKTDLRDQQL